MTGIANVTMNVKVKMMISKIILLEFFPQAKYFALKIYKLINEKNVQYPFMIMNTDRNNKKKYALLETFRIACS